MTLIPGETANKVSHQSAERTVSKLFLDHGIQNETVRAIGLAKRVQQVIDSHDLKRSRSLLLSVAWFSRAGIAFDTFGSGKPYSIASAKYARENGASDEAIHLLARFGAAPYLLSGYPESTPAELIEFSPTLSPSENGVKLEEVLLVAELTTGEGGKPVDARERLRAMINGETPLIGTRQDFNRAWRAYSAAKGLVGWF